jgi:signal transduction histidine kinase
VDSSQGYRRVLAEWVARLPSGSARLRLSLLYGALFLGCSGALLTLVYVVVAHLPVNVDSHVIVGSPGAVGVPATSGPLPEIGSPATIADRQRDADLHRVLVGSATALAAMSVASVGLGWLMAGRVLRPLRTMTATTRGITASDLHRRLALSGPADELKELGDTIDDLLGRLERSFIAQRQFVANASHELRTPLTLQRALLEAALTDPDPSGTSWRQAAERAIAAGEHQERILDALLTLARGEAGPDRQEVFDLAEVADRALRACRESATGRPGALAVRARLHQAPIRGDARLVERLASNLIDNALRHNVEAGWVEVRTQAGTGGATLSVDNSGPHVQETELGRLFLPFQRLGQARTRGHGGLGLGLSIVRAIADAHNARVDVRPRSGGGLQVAVTFPVPPGPPRCDLRAD